MRIRLIVISFILFLQVSVLAQETAKDYLKNLSDSLTINIKNDSLKLVAIFNWVVENIEYDIELFKVDEYEYPEFNIDVYLDSSAYIHRYNEEIARRVSITKKAICDGYAKLMYSLCDYAGLECVIISGKTRKPLRDHLGNHAWNAVKLNGQWYLLDATWASGHVNLSRTRFVKEKDMFFFLTPPELLIYDHLPNNMNWSLLDEEIAFAKFNNSPVLCTQPFRSGLVDYSPKTKTIFADTSKALSFVFEFDNETSIEDVYISGSPIESLQDLLDIEVTRDNHDSLYAIYPDLSRVIPKIEILNSKRNGNRIEYNIKPINQNLDEIDVYINSSFPSLTYSIEF